MVKICHKFKVYFSKLICFAECLDVSSDGNLSTPTVIYNNVDDEVEADLHPENMPI